MDEIIIFFWLLILAAVCSTIRILFSPSRRALIAVFIFTLLALAHAGFWNWLLRDGLGPDAITSTGLEAWKRFASEMLFPGAICLGIIVVAVAFRRFRRRA
jgi:hypothetical protein